MKHKRLLLLSLTVVLLLTSSALLILLLRKNSKQAVSKSTPQAVSKKQTSAPSEKTITVLEQGVGRVVPSSDKIAVFINIRIADPVTSAEIDATYNNRSKPLIIKLYALPEIVRDAIAGQKTGTTVRLAVPSSLAAQLDFILKDGVSLPNGALADIYISNYVEADK